MTRAYSTRKLIGTCWNCGKEFEYRQSKNDRERVYCSRPCFYEGLHKNKGGAIVNGLPQVKEAITVRPCLACEEDYEVKMWNQKWCSNCVPDKAAASRMLNYGVSQRDWDRMLIEQHGMCALCKIRPATVMDHCHKTLKNRRPLCQGCNMALGRFEEDGWFEKAKNYLESEVI